jgi:serine/threonine protein kinase
LANFDLPKKISEASEHILTGLLPYMDPKCLNNKFNIKEENQPYVINTKSDIYSIGVLFWQLSSGHDPFDDENTKDDSSLAMEIINGKRENIIIDTPVEYSDLYTGK